MIGLLPLADMHEVFPVLALLVFFLPAILAIMSKHQQKMAMITRHGTANPQSLPTETDPRVLAELAELRRLIHEQMLMIDNLNRTQQDLIQKTPSQEMRERIGQI
jgi:type IV secretory pathway protease TraF